MGVVGARMLRWALTMGRLESEIENGREYLAAYVTGVGMVSALGVGR